MVIFPLAPDQTIAQMWSNGARGGVQPTAPSQYHNVPPTAPYHKVPPTGTVLIISNFTHD